MTCRELTELLVEYYEGDLDPDVQEVMDRHREICPYCEGFLRTYKATILLTEEALRQPMPEAAKESLEAQIISALAESRVG
jgi:anti-sigma factor ChrR (cupin superfamily)